MNTDHRNTAFEKMSNLPNKLPPGTSFEKLHGEGVPYRCVEWKHDRRGIFCMYYQFLSHKKRIPLSEIEAAMRHLGKEKRFNRKDFKTLCPISCKGGPCGFAVIGRSMEKLAGAEYAGKDGFVLVKNS